MYFLRQLLFFIIIVYLLSIGGFCSADPQYCLNQKYAVQGNSLKPLINPNQNIEIIRGYYDIHDVKRGDIVAYKHIAYKEPIIKIVKALPGDRFKLKKNSQGRVSILINDNICLNSENKSYSMNPNKIKMLALHEKQYDGLIPEDVYLVLGNAARGSFDSSEFGLIPKRDIIGKVNPVE